MEDPGELFSVGDEKNAKILKMNPSNKKISLSFRQAQTEMQKLEYQKYVNSQDNKMTLGDIMKDLLIKISKTKEKETKRSKKDDKLVVSTPSIGVQTFFPYSDQHRTVLVVSIARKHIEDERELKKHVTVLQY